MNLVAAALLAAQPVDCDDALAQQDMNRCAAASAREADAELNRVYPQVVRQMQRYDRDAETGGEAERRLREAQRAWIAFRDAQCSLAGVEALGGSLEPLLVSGCIKDLTERRISELQMMLLDR